MYAGRIVEVGHVRDVLQDPRHPYTVGLMRSIPRVGATGQRLAQIDGAMPRLNAIPTGCAFHPRCPRRFERCDRERPDLIATEDRLAACWLYDHATVE
jgi:peptide/nickel transport system ATP-binding protein